MSPSALLTVLSAGVLFLGLHIVLWRLKPSSAPRVFQFFGLAATCMLVSEIVYYILPGAKPAELFAILGIESFLVILYSLAYGSLARSVSITLLTRLYGEGKLFLEFESLLNEYLSSTRFEERVHAMHEAGLIVMSGDRITLTVKGNRAARAAQTLSHIFSDGVEGY